MGGFMAFIYMMLMGIGLCVMCGGWKLPNKSYWRSSGALLTVGGMLAGVASVPSSDFPDGDPGMVGFGVVLILSGLSILIVGIVKSHKEGKEILQARQEAKEKETLRQFYENCRSQGIDDLSTPMKLQKAKLIADALGIGGSNDIEKLFAEAQEKIGGEERRAKEEALRKKRQEERDMERLLSRYADYSGRDKRIAMLTDLMNAKRQEAAKYDPNRFNSLYHAGQQKEHNWAMLGGMASGLAGGAAGVATAVDAQIDNARIRAQNQANAAAFGQFGVTMLEQKMKSERAAKDYEVQITSAKMKLVSETPTASVMEKLSLENVKVGIRDTGAFTVDATAVVNGPLEDFEGRRSVIDGTIQARLLQDGKAVGTAKLVLPMYGVNAKANLSGMCCGSADPSKEYTVEFEPYKLWIMEA